MTDNDTPPTRPQVTSDDDWLNEAADWWSEALSVAGAGFRERMTKAARDPLPEAQERVNAALFEEHVSDDLRAIISGYACFVRLGMSSYSDAYAACRLYANRRGSWGLSDKHLLDLHQWIQDRLGEAIEQEG